MTATHSTTLQDYARQTTDAAAIIGDGPTAKAIAALAPELFSEPERNENTSAVCIVPSLAAALPAPEWTAAHLAAAVGDPLVWVVHEVQSVIVPLIEAGKPGRIVIILPAEEALGRAGDAAAGAVCGGILSMARTLSLELKRKAITVNVVCVDTGSCYEKPAIAQALRGQLELLLRRDSWITGQEIWVTDGTEAGRVRP